MGKKGGKKEKEEKGDLSEIIPNFLWLGSAKAARNRAVLQEVGITHVVCCAGRTPFSDVVYHKCHFADATDASFIRLLPDIFKFIGQAKATKHAKVLVHCLGGRSRSPAVVLAYLMSQKPPATLAAAFAFVQKCRPAICPNEGFVVQLIALEATLFGGVSTTKLGDLTTSKHGGEEEKPAEDDE